MKLAAVLLGLVLGLASATATAITWGEAKARDPVSGRNVTVQEPMSSGSYIYQYPGKEHLVFWPHTDDAWLWFNPATGYIAFGGDFRELAEDKVAPLRDWLKANYDGKKPPEARLERLRWAEQVYGQRGMDDDFWLHFYRLMAFELTEDAAASLEYVRKAMPYLEKRLAQEEKPNARAETLYLLGEYHRRLGNPELARGFFARLRVSPVTDGDGKVAENSWYLVERAAEAEALMSPSAEPPKPPE